MLTRSHRFHGYGSLRSTYTHGQTVRGSLVSLRYALRSNGKPYRVAVVVSRKVHKSAVIRNRIRRRIYELVRQSQAVPPSTDLIFMVFSDQVATIEAERLNSIINELLSKVTLQQKKST
jgi:ribonuclease P protein component